MSKTRLFSLGIVVIILGFMQTPIKGVNSKIVKADSSISPDRLFYIQEVDTTRSDDIVLVGFGGRKITYRDSTLASGKENFSGKIGIKACINRLGEVTYVELLGAETNVSEKTILKKYLRSVRYYKFQPDRTAEREECGTIKFDIYNNN